MLSSAWDRGLGLRAASLAAIAALVTVIVIAATDEGGPWSVRLGMAAALAPIAGALGATGALGIAAGRGELRALAAIGVDPSRASFGAVLGGAAVGLAGAAAAASRYADLAALFPRPAAARVWMIEGGGLREATLGLAVDASGALSLGVPAASAQSGLPIATGPFAVATIAIAALACPAWVAAKGSGGAARRAIVGAAAIVAGIAAFQAVAAGRAPAAALLAAPAALIVDLLIGAAIVRYVERRA